jgi:uncharacterized protein (DUF2336 family)
MVAYQDFVALSRSGDSEERGQAAHLAAQAYLRHAGPPDEHAALYAALIGFLDDPSVRVRAALAYGLLHTSDAPRPILLALLQDSEVIARAVAQYSPALIDADLIGIARNAGPVMLHALAQRPQVSARVAEALVARDLPALTLRVVQRADIPVPPGRLAELALSKGLVDAELRGALLARNDLPPAARLQLVDAAVDALRRARIVRGAIAAPRLERLLRDAVDTALTEIGEGEAVTDGKPFAAEVVASERVSARVMLHAVVNGHVLFFADVLGVLASTPREKVFTLLEAGSRASLNALLARCGLNPAVSNLIARLIFHARAADLADDVTARHFVVTALTEELIVEHGGVIPPELEDAFAYLSDQNVALARRAAKGVMSAFAGDAGAERAMPLLPEGDDLLALPAA